MLEYQGEIRRIDPHGGGAPTRKAEIALDTDLGSRDDAFNLTELLLAAIDCVLTVYTDETDRRLELLHKNVRKYGAISNTVAAATTLDGVIRRQA